MSKLSKKPYDYGSAFTAIDEMDKAMEGMERVLDKKIDELTDLFSAAVAHLKELEEQIAKSPVESKSVKRRKKIQKDGKIHQKEVMGLMDNMILMVTQLLGAKPAPKGRKAAEDRIADRVASKFMEEEGGD